MLEAFSASLYIDPAATSILITSIGGIAIALSSTAIILWRKFKKTVSKVIKIDENAGKEVEDEVVITDVEEAPAAEATETEATEEAPITETAEADSEKAE